MWFAKLSVILIHSLLSQPAQSMPTAMHANVSLLGPHPQGSVHLDASALTMRTLHPNGTVLHVRAVTPEMREYIHDVFVQVQNDTEIVPFPRAPSSKEASGAGAGANKGADTNANTAACSPPITCQDHSDCTADCSACTFISWYPYGLCLDG